MTYVEHQHIKEWLGQHEGEILGVQHSGILDEYLNSLPWTSSGIRWGKISHIKLEIPQSPDATFIRECLETPMGSHSHALIMYNGSEKSILCRAEDAFRDIDLLYLRAPGPRYFCGVDVTGDSITVCAKDFAEYDIAGLTFRASDG
ncbi:hypothetical protein [Streptomyces sp. C184]|uniref:hypothetical protein n=1 Tax=Streptomyces sp. C184 TaxID=3237121 RepID=UPI0034C673F7